MKVADFFVQVNFFCINQILHMDFICINILFTIKVLHLMINTNIYF